MKKVAFLLIFLVILSWVFVYFDMFNFKNNNIHKKGVALGVLNDDPEIEARHVWIAENCPGKLPNGDVPVHIMFRQDDMEKWQLLGTGIILSKYPNFILTAQHVFEGVYGQYGYRKIGLDALTGKALVMPIVSYEKNINRADDSIFCRISTNTQDRYFPAISPVLVKDRFREFSSQPYECEIRTNLVRLSTYPEKGIQGMVMICVGPGIWYMFFDQDVMPGESGTCAKLDGSLPNEYLVVVRHSKIKEGFYKRLGPEVHKIVKWSPDKMFGLCFLIDINPAVPEFK